MIRIFQEIIFSWTKKIFYCFESLQKDCSTGANFLAQFDSIFSAIQLKKISRNKSEKGQLVTSKFLYVPQKLVSRKILAISAFQTKLKFPALFSVEIAHKAGRTNREGVI